MLRITVLDSSEALTFRVEGRLVGDWAKELDHSWNSATPLRGKRAPIIDLTGILFVDEEGKRVLTKLFREGAFFRTAGPMIESIISEITSQIRGKSRRAFEADGPRRRGNGIETESSGAGRESKPCSEPGPR